MPITKINLIPIGFHRFKSNPLLSGKFLSTDIIEIDDSYVTHKRKKSPFSAVVAKSIPVRNIINIKISRSGYGASVLIESLAKTFIFGKGFTTKNAREIKRLLQR